MEEFILEKQHTQYLCNEDIVEGGQASGGRFSLRKIQLLLLPLKFAAPF